MKLYRYETIEGLNLALEDFTSKGIPIAKVKLLTESTNQLYDASHTTIKLVTVFYVLTDEAGNYQPKSEVPLDDENKDSLNPDERRSSEEHGS